VGKFILTSSVQYDWLYNWAGPTTVELNYKARGMDLDGLTDAQIESQYEWLHKDKWGDWRDNQAGSFQRNLSSYIDPEYQDRTLHWGNSEGRGICPVGYRVPTFMEYKAEDSNKEFLHLVSAKREPDTGLIYSSNRIWTNSYSSIHSGTFYGLSLYFDINDNSNTNNDRYADDYNKESPSAGLAVRCIQN